jgi:CRISPR-associated endonuclease Cas2
MILTDNGKKKALTYNIDAMKIKKPTKWDGKWRMVLFDIPEKHKKAREAFREALKDLEFHEFQKSVFIHPYECQNELDYIIELFQLRPYVRTVTATKLDNELHIKKVFELI